MKRYVVIGTAAVFRIKIDGEFKEHSLKNGESVELPPDNPTTETLLLRNIIKECPEDTGKKSEKTDKKSEK